MSLDEGPGSTICDTWLLLMGDRIRPVVERLQVSGESAWDPKVVVASRSAVSDEISVTLNRRCLKRESVYAKS